jgi:hypothetical protein
MKKALSILLAAGLSSLSVAEGGRMLKNGPIAIRLNEEPSVAIQGRPKTNYLDEKLGIKPTEDMQPTDEQFDFLANHTDLTRSVPPEWVAEIKKRNPDFMFMEYTASTYLKQKYWNREELEKEYAHHLAMCPAAVLDKAIDPETTEFTVSPYTYPENEITSPYYSAVQPTLEKLQEKDERIRNYNDVIPIYASAVKEGYSKNTREFLFFLRLDNELMRVDDWDRETGKLKVTRGFNGSTAVHHPNGTVLTSPLYCANGGTPQTEPKYYGKPQKIKKDQQLHYCKDKGALNMPILEKKAEEVVSIMRDGIFDGISMDAMSAKLPQFRMVNALGLKAVPWNFEKGRPYSVYEWVEGHDRMCGVIQRYVLKKLGRWPVVVANGISRNGFEKGQGDGGYCKRLLLPTKLKSRPLESYNSEVGLRTTGSAFADQLHLLQIAFQENLTPSMGFSGPSKALTQEMYNEELNYSGAFLYMAYEPKPEGWDFKKDGTGPVIRSSYISPFFHLDSVGPEWKPEGGQTYKIGLPYVFYLPLGKPLESPTPGDLEAIRYKDTNVFMRKYENGLVLINPTYNDTRKRLKGQEARIDQDLDTDYIPHGPINTPTTYTVKLDRRYTDPLTGNYVHGEIKMPPVSGKILLIEPSL